MPPPLETIENHVRLFGMPQIRHLQLASIVSVVGFFVGPADAHLRLTSHEARYGDTQKSCPCGVGGGERSTDKVYWAKPGSEVLLVWDEFVEHPSHFRIAFDSDGVDDLLEPHLNNPVCADTVMATPEACFEMDNQTEGWVDGIPDNQVGGIHNYLYTLPNVTCDNCTLQVVQVMYDKPPFLNALTDPAGQRGNDLYYQCLDIILDPAGPDTLELHPAPPAPVNPGGGTDSCLMLTNGDGNFPPNPLPPTPTVGTQSGCSTGGDVGLSLVLLLSFVTFRSRYWTRNSTSQTSPLSR